MPLTLTLTEGVIPAGTEQQVIQKITDSMLKWHGLNGNKVMTPNVTASVHVLPRGTTFSGGKEISAAWVEWKTPSFAFAEEDIQKGFFDDATTIIHELSNEKLPRDKIYINVVHTVDGAWNMNGRAMSNAEIGETISRG